MLFRVPMLGLLLLPPLAAACRDASPAAPDVPRVGTLSASFTQNDTGPGPGPVFKTVGNFEAADVSFFRSDPNGFTSGFLSVSQTRTAGADQQTNLFYSITSCSFNGDPPPGDTIPGPPPGCTFEGGFGLIPNGDFRGRVNSAMSLETNTSAEANPEFFRFDGAGGPISLTWAKNDLFFHRSQGHSDTRFGDLRFRSQGTFTSASASVSGSLIGQPLAGDLGSMSSGHNAFFEMSVANVVQAAAGSGHLTVGGELRTFSFSAVRLADGRVKGQWERFNRAVGVRDHGRVSCFTIQGNRVWLGGPATFATTPGETAWRAADNGAGKGAVRDQISLQFVGGGPGFSDSYCAGQPESPALLTIDAGNISIQQ